MENLDLHIIEPEFQDLIGNLYFKPPYFNEFNTFFALTKKHINGQYGLQI